MSFGLMLLPVLGFAYCGGEASSDQDAAAGQELAGPAKDAPALVFLGDSLTAGRGLAKSQSAPALIQAKLLEAGLEYRVVNAGRSGDTSARGLGLGQRESNLKEIVKRTREYDANIRVFLFQMHIFPNMGPEYQQGYEDVFRRVAKEMDIGLLPFPLLNVGGVPELNQDDGIHPNVEGTKIVAENIWGALQGQL